MSIKNELILSYIKELDAGTKISVRSLSEILDVSVGTVYKAIKAAEAQGLVVTKPKSGTFKIDSRVALDSEPVSLKRAVKLLGLTTIIEPADADRLIEHLIICDGSEEQLRRALSKDAKENVNVLCLVGDRPEMQALIIELGANLMLTGGASAEPLTLIYAERSGRAVISALQDSITVMLLLEKLRTSFTESPDEAQAWMKMPQYLYSNDKVSGVLDMNDVLRYFMFSGGSGGVPMFESFLEASDVSETDDEKYYNIRIPNRGAADPSEFTLPVVLTAALRHASQILGEGCVIESGTFFASKTIGVHESLMLSSKLTRRGEQGCTLEEEIFDDSFSYTKAILMFTAKQGE